MAKKVYYLGKSEIIEIEHKAIVDALCSADTCGDYNDEILNTIRGIVQFADKLVAKFDEEEEE